MKYKIKRIVKLYTPWLFFVFKELYNYIKNFYIIIKFSFKIKKFSLIKNKKVYFFCTPCYGNLGDQAIAFSQEKFMRQNMTIYNEFEITEKEYSLAKKIVKKYINDRDLICLMGGGNLGTLWVKEDGNVSEIIRTYRQNKIIVFPQTVYYDNTVEGKQRLENNKAIYNEAKNLTICLRDKISYDFCKLNFPTTNLIFTPDIVLSINDLKYEEKRKDVLLCLRSDKEKSLDDNFNQEIENYFKKSNIKYSYTDTVIKEKVDCRTRNEKLDEKWREFASAKLVITDRLHGMIFATITGTPCLAVDNLSKKVSGVYSWIMHLDYVKICYNANEIIENIDEFYKKEDCIYAATVCEKFEELKELLVRENDL